MSIKLDRNNTNFPLALFEALKKLSTNYNNKDFLYYYQQLLREYFQKVQLDSRGLLLHISMGVGKTMTGAAIAFGLMDKYEPIVLLSKSLQENMRGGLKKFVRMQFEGMSDAEASRMVDDKFSFVSLNASNMIQQMRDVTLSSIEREMEKRIDKNIKKVAELQTLNGKLLIIDEAHNFFRAIVNGSKNAVSLYRIIIASKDLKLVFLTGTPVVNDPYELIPCFNMLGSREPKKLIFPEDYKKFHDYFIDENGLMKNIEQFQDRIFGLVSNVTHESKQGVAFGIKQQIMAKFPTQLPIKVIKIPMTRHQFMLYQAARDKEKKEATFGKAGKAGHAISKPKSDKTSTYRIKSRQLSNYAPNIKQKEFSSPKLEEVAHIISNHPNQKGLIYSAFVKLSGVGGIEIFLKNLGWEEKVIVGDMVKVGTTSKLNEENQDASEIETAESARVEGGGEQLRTGQSYSIIGGVEKKYFAVIKGNTTKSDRDRLIDYYNLPENDHGDNLALLVVSSVGAEGLDLKCGRYVIIYEPFWNYVRIEQVIARAVRNNSHITLPEDEQNVQPYILLAVAPEETEDLSTDEDLYLEAVRKNITNNSCVAAIDAVSIECMVNGESHCRTCMPNNMTLFGDLDKDINKPSKCRQVESKKISVDEIEIDGKKYFYQPSDDSAYGFDIYYMDELSGKYRALSPNSSNFEKIIEELTKLNTN